MKTQWISLPQDRPRCSAANVDGRRCREPVLWDEQANRPLSTRCRDHGGLADAAMTTRTTALGACLRGLPALALAAALCLSWAAPALADFQSAVAAYERGAYRQAQSEFESLAAAGDERAEAYLERIRDRLRGASPDGGSGGAARSAGSSASAQPGKAAPDRTTAPWQAWSVFGQAGEQASPPPAGSDIVTPRRGSLWSAIFHLPGDATVIGLQYVAEFLSADNLHRELQILSRKSDGIALSILAVGWWLLIVRVLVGLGFTVGRIMKVAANPKEQQHYG